MSGILDVEREVIVFRIAADRHRRSREPSAAHMRAVSRCERHLHVIAAGATNCADARTKQRMSTLTSIMRGAMDLAEKPPRRHERRF